MNCKPAVTLTCRLKQGVSSGACARCSAGFDWAPVDLDGIFPLVFTAMFYGCANARPEPSALKESGLWVPQQVLTKDLLVQFGYVRSPQVEHSLLLKT